MISVAIFLSFIAGGVFTIGVAGVYFYCLSKVGNE